MKNIFIDGSAGTTGLRIVNRLSQRQDISLLSLPDELRKNKTARQEIMNKADIVFLCLPDDAAIEAVTMVENENTVIIDTSTAHRTAENFAYGFPELSQKFENNIISSNRISVPGCHASGFIALVKPIVDSGIIKAEENLTCHSLTGYSGGGKKMIADYENDGRDIILDAPRMYGLSGNHKHLKEMKKITGLTNEPIFCPIVSDYYSGMLVTVPLFNNQLENGFGIKDIVELYKEKYNTPLVTYKENADNNGFISANRLSGLDKMEISVFGNEERIFLTAGYDNLGKGASGAAIECMNIKLGTDKYSGLVL